jgi:hypothetical protein
VLGPGRAGQVSRESAPAESDAPLPVAVNIPATVLRQTAFRP